MEQAFLFYSEESSTTHRDYGTLSDEAIAELLEQFPDDGLDMLKAIEAIIQKETPK